MPKTAKPKPRVQIAGEPELWYYEVYDAKGKYVAVSAVSWTSKKVAERNAIEFAKFAGGMPVVNGTV